MSDVIPPYLADLLREWRAHDGRANPCQCEEDLAAWVDEHLPAPDLGPVDLDTFGIDSIDDDEIDAFLAVIRDDGIPPEHPRWPDGTPVYVGQRATWNERWAGVTSSSIGLIEQIESAPLPHLIVRSNGIQFAKKLDELTRLDPKATTDE